jgi:hypothetical protein
MVIFADEELARTLSGARLGPLQELRPGQRDMLAETLLSWLQNGGNAKAVARQLHVHPQTARYRLRQLHGLFGEVLGDPDSRFELEIALRARRLLGPANPGPRAGSDASRTTRSANEAPRASQTPRAANGTARPNGRPRAANRKAPANGKSQASGTPRPPNKTARPGGTPRPANGTPRSPNGKARPNAPAMPGTAGLGAARG